MGQQLMERKVIILIPARMGSRRFPGKPLHKIGRFPLVCWTYVQAKMTGYCPFVITPDNEIVREMARLGIPCLLTSHKPTNGTERCAEIVEQLDLEERDLIINVQGDILEFDYRSINSMVALLNKGDFEYVTGFAKLPSGYSEDPNKVKCAIKSGSRNLSISVPNFSRESIPGTQNFLHVGIYGFTEKSLRKYANLFPTINETAKKLEQMRIVDNGMEIGGVFMGAPTTIDCLEDVRLAQEEKRKAPWIESRGCE
jgi:3-deoxy-manno-octulosonate cytidylyltransferase (CMP-KDO synthetase)